MALKQPHYFDLSNLMISPNQLILGRRHGQGWTRYDGWESLFLQNNMIHMLNTQDGGSSRLAGLRIQPLRHSWNQLSLTSKMDPLFLWNAFDTSILHFGKWRSRSCWPRGMKWAYQELSLNMSYEEYWFSESASWFSSSYIKPQLCTSQEASVLTNTPGFKDAKRKRKIIPLHALLLVEKNTGKKV